MLGIRGLAAAVTWEQVTMPTSFSAVLLNSHVRAHVHKRCMHICLKRRSLYLGCCNWQEITQSAQWRASCSLSSSEGPGKQIWWKSFRSVSGCLGETENIAGSFCGQSWKVTLYQSGPLPASIVTFEIQDECESNFYINYSWFLTN